MDHMPAGEARLGEYQQYFGVFRRRPGAVDQYFKQQIGQVGDGDGEREPDLTPVMVDEKEQRGHDDGQGPHDGVVKTADEFHEECKAPAALLLDLPGHIEVKAGYRITLDKISQSDNTDRDQGIKG